ncbi:MULTISPECIES: cell wall metabolism sensor histidine kinase WalK [unclassified Pseudofrankia]|uniref:sensor histidine kinase n=1 Tax=unclassified Pseudofrankia TaxID=2994372 RepID=UPI0008DA268D|nr:MULTISPECIES: ATP-binding protein [unclassified Pseudofrankia]MDT3446160.1 ATP-binding protein [Pseudofrankia sp. BMG5.37]OHV62296.1 two-component sensor histidine kinase [Pseudofrankia sp. BMG5.36]
MRRSVRTRLLMAFIAGTVIVLVLGLSLLYVVLDRQLRGALDADLADRAGDLAVSVRTGDRTVVSGDPMAQVYAADGTVVTGSAELGGRRLLDAEQVRAVHDAVLVGRDLPLGYRGAPLRVRLRSQPVGASGLVLTVGVAATSVERASDRQFMVLLLAAPLLIAALAALGWILIRAALRPVDALTRQAAAISSLDSTQRLPPVHGDDEIARLAATLDSMLARLAVAFTRERAFVDDASHELRTPIAVLRGEIDLALTALDDRGEVEQSLLAARGQVDRLTRLTEDLLLLARERAGSLVVHRQPVDLTDLALAEAAALGRVTGLRIEVHSEPVVVEADPDRLRQVLTNLAANSAAAGATTADVRITADRDTTAVAWADDGPGFPPDLVDSAFERFVRGDAARTTTGAGLGLSIVRAIVVAHGGSVQVRNGAPLGGAVVTVGLPLT